MTQLRRSKGFSRINKAGFASTMTSNGKSQEAMHWTVRLSHVSSALATIFLAAGSVVAFFEYRSSIAQGQIERSFQMIEQWEADGYRSILKDVSRFVADAELRASNVLKEASTPANSELLLNFTQRALLDEFDLAHPDKIDDLFYFFNKISLCSSSELCDDEVISDFFGDTLVSFRRQADLVVRDRRVRVLNYSVELDDFIGYR